MSEKNPGYYRIPEGAKDLLSAIHPKTPHMLASAIEYLWRAGRKPGNHMCADVRKARNMIVRWLEVNDLDPPDEEPTPEPTPATEPAKPEPEVVIGREVDRFARLAACLAEIWICELAERDGGYEGIFESHGGGRRVRLKESSMELLILKAYAEVRK